MVRCIFVWLHRWLGLAMAAFLVLEGLTGSLLAFRKPLLDALEHWLGLQFFATPRPQLTLSLAALARAA